MHTSICGTRKYDEYSSLIGIFTISPISLRILSSNYIKDYERLLHETAKTNQKC